MSKHRSALFLIALLGLVSSGTVNADTEMRCGGSLIEAGGDLTPTEIEVLDQCGQPSSRQASQQGSYWHYDLPDGRSYRLYFNKNGKLESIQEEDR